MMLRPKPVLRRDAFRAGLERLGFQVREGRPTEVCKGDVLVIWNRYNDSHEQALHVEQAGGLVIVAENGYLGEGGSIPKFALDEEMKPEHYLALSIHGHNGSGHWRRGGAERWERLGIDIKPWQRAGEYILICPNRSFGTPGMVMPEAWVQDVSARIARVTKRLLVLREHPGSSTPSQPISDALKRAWACVVWSSSSGVHALVAGVPVLCESPYWVCKGSALRTVEQLQELEAGSDPDSLIDVRREESFHHLAWAQWTIEEVGSGQALRSLLYSAGAM